MTFTSRSVRLAALSAVLALPAIALGQADNVDADLDEGGASAGVDLDSNAIAGDEIYSRDVLEFGESMSGAFDLAPSGVGDGALGDVTARAGVLVQARGVFSYFDPEFGDDELDFGFENSRVKPYVFGTIGPDDGLGFLSAPVEYRVQGTFVPDGGDFVLEDAYAVLPLNDTFAVRAGQFLNLISAEGTTFGGYNLAVDRSLAAATLGSPGRVQGATAIFTPPDKDNLRAEFGITDGAGSANSAFFSDDADLAVAGRAEFLINGEWAAIEDFTAITTDTDTSAFGVGGEVLFQGDTTLLITSGDYRLEKADGLSVYGGVFLTFGQFEGDGTFNLAATGQVAKVLDNDFEPFGRASVLVLDDDLATVADDFSLELTGGVNYYLDPQMPHRVKLTADVGFLPVGSPSQPQLDYANSGDFQFIVRGQLQILL